MRNNRRGNPNWGRPQVPSLNAQEKPTAFSLFLGGLGIPEQGCERYPDVRRWIKTHAKLCYIPEELLTAIGETVEFQDI